MNVYNTLTEYPYLIQCGNGSLIDSAPTLEDVYVLAGASRTELQRIFYHNGIFSGQSYVELYTEFDDKPFAVYYYHEFKMCFKFREENEAILFKLKFG